MSYRSHPCPNCGRHRVELDGICEKCTWNEDTKAYAAQCDECMRPTANEDGYCSDACREYANYMILPPKPSLDICPKCMFQIENCKCEQFSSNRP